MKTILFSLATIALTSCCKWEAQQIASLNAQNDSLNQQIKNLNLEKAYLVDQLNVGVAVLEVLTLDMEFEDNLLETYFEDPFVDRKKCVYKCAGEANTRAQAECGAGNKFEVFMCRAKHLNRMKGECAVGCFEFELPGFKRQQQ